MLLATPGNERRDPDLAGLPAVLVVVGVAVGAGPSAHACRSRDSLAWTEPSYYLLVGGSTELIGPTTRRNSRTEASISAVFRAVAPKPVNVLVSPQDAATLAELQTIGVRRISLGVDPYTHALAATQAAAAKLHQGLTRPRSRALGSWKQSPVRSMR